MKKTIWILLFCLCSSVGFTKPTTTPTFEVAGDTLIARALETQEIVWQNQYPSAQLHEGTPEYPIVGPILHKNELFYAVRGDLFTVDPHSGVVIRRQAYPTFVSHLAATETGLNLTLSASPTAANDATDQVVAYHRDAKLGPPMLGSFHTSRRAAHDAARRSHFLAAVRTSRNVDEVVARIARDEVRDPTNPFLPLLRGLLTSRSKPTEESEKAITLAIAMPMTWAEKLQMAQILESVGRSDTSRRLFVEAKNELKENGADFDTFTDMTAVVFGDTFTDEIKAATAAGDVERADELADRLFKEFPCLEGFGSTWLALANWFAARGETGRAEKWRSRGVEDLLKTPFVLAQAIVEACLKISSGALFVMLLLGSWISVRTEVAKPTKTEKAAFVMLGVISLLTLLQGLQGVERTGLLAYSPVELGFGTMSTPEVMTWLETLTPSSERDALIVQAKEAQNRLGTSVAPKVLDRDMLDAAISQTATTQAAQGLIPHITNAILGRFSKSFATWVLLAAGFWLFMRRASPKIRSRAILLIPGSQSGGFAPMIQSLFVVGVLSLLDENLLEVALELNFAKYIGIPAAGDILPRHEIGLGLIATALVAHVLTAWWTRRGQVDLSQNSRNEA